MGSLIAKEKNDPRVRCRQVENIYKYLKGEIENFTDFVPDTAFRTEEQNWTMLHLAVWFSNKRMVENLLEHGFDVAAKDVVLAIQHEETPLHLAAYQNNQEIYDLLKSRPNSDPTLKNRVRFIQEGKTADDLLKENSN